MLQPSRTKFRKAHKGRIHGVATSAKDLTFGQYGLKAIEPERVTARQIEAARRAITRHMKRAGPGVDSRLSGRSGVEEAARSPHGLGQGLASNSGSAASSPAASCSRSTACVPPSSPSRRSRLPPPSCRSRPALCRASPPNRKSRAKP